MKGMNKYAYLSALLLPCSLISCDEQVDENPIHDSYLIHDSHGRNESAMSAKDMYAKAKSLIKPESKAAAELGKTLISEALDWTQKAAEKGLVQAQTDLGALYMYGGKGVDVNAKESFKWFTKAADQGSVAARCFIGDLLYHGAEGLPQDKSAAIENWLEAAQKGLPEAQYRVGREFMRAVDSAAAGRVWLEKAADSGFAKAALDLGFVHARGVSGATGDMAKAALWYEKAAKLGNPKALYICSLMLESGEFMPQDSARALSLLKMSAGQDYLPAVGSLVEYLNIRAASGDTQAESEAKAWANRYVELSRKVKTLKLKPQV